MTSESARADNAAANRACSSAGTPAADSASAMVSWSASSRTTATICGVLRNVSRRLPKWYASAPNGSGRSATDGLSRYGRLRSSAMSVDAAHTVDRDLFDEGLLDVDDDLVVAVVGARGGAGNVCRVERAAACRRVHCGFLFRRRTGFPPRLRRSMNDGNSPA